MDKTLSLGAQLLCAPTLREGFQGALLAQAAQLASALNKKLRRHTVGCFQRRSEAVEVVFVAWHDVEQVDSVLRQEQHQACDYISQHDIPVE